MKQFVVAALEKILLVVLAGFVVLGWTQGNSWCQLVLGIWWLPGFIENLIGAGLGFLLGAMVTGVVFTLISINSHLAAIRTSLAARPGNGAERVLQETTP